MRKFLVINMNYMGDALLTTPAIAALRRAYPDARIDTVVGAGAAAEVLGGNPDLDTIIARTAPGSLGRVMQTFRLLREGQYTDAIILPPLPAYAAAAWMARTLAPRGPRRAGDESLFDRYAPDPRSAYGGGDAGYHARAARNQFPAPCGYGRPRKRQQGR